MKRYNITVNGKVYDVAVEEVNGAAPMPAATPAPAAAAPAPAPAPAAEEKAAPAPAAPVEGGTEVTSPMPGTVLDIKVNVGDTVAAGQAVIVLEAMKMENDINAPVAGKVMSINVTKGASVETGTLLAVIG